MLILYFFLCFFPAIHAQTNWALLVAGSSGYYNYRHQADVCHAYHVLVNHGFPRDNIVVMMYDDVAHSKENPFPGELINHPNGTNVYKGVKIDYSKDDVNPQVFLAVLKGDAYGVQKLTGHEGKVLRSGPADRIFVNFVDHGAPGLLAFPRAFLHAKELHETIEQMYEFDQYKQMVMYIEACESGSMFHKLLEKNIDVFVTTAANPGESSYACYYDEKRGTYLGDVYSVNWMEDSDKENLDQETLKHQFRFVRRHTNKSHVMEYGDRKISKLTVGDFVGNDSSNTMYFQPTNRRSPLDDAVPAYLVEEEILKKQIKMADKNSRHHHTKRLKYVYKRKQQTEKFFSRVIQRVAAQTHHHSYMHSPANQASNPSNWLSDRSRPLPPAWVTSPCYTGALDAVVTHCPGMQLSQNYHGLRQLRGLAALCGTTAPASPVLNAAIKHVAMQSTICPA